jgi:hypothetical protein
MNPIPTLLVCAKFGYAVLAMLSPDIALVVSPLLDLLNKLGPTAARAVQA